MNAKSLVPGIALSLIMATGCASLKEKFNEAVGNVRIEDVKAQLASSDKAQVEAAENEIYSIATRGTSSKGFVSYTEAEQLQFLDLTKNQELLFKVIDDARTQKMRQEAVARLDGSLENANRVFKIYAERPYLENLNLMSRLDLNNKEIASALIREFRKTADFEKTTCFKTALEALGEKELAALSAESDMDHDVEIAVNSAYVQKTTSGKVLYNFVTNGRWGIPAVALERVKKDFPNVLSALFLTEGRTSYYAEMMTEQQIVTAFVRAPSKVNSCALDYLDEMKDQKQLKEIFTKAKNREVRWHCLKKIEVDEPSIMKFAEGASDVELNYLIGRVNDPENKKKLRAQRVELKLEKIKAAKVLDESYAQLIDCQEAAEYALEHMDLSGLRDRDEWTYGISQHYSEEWQAAAILATVVKYIGKDTLDRLVSEAESRAKEMETKTIVVDGFYLGMPRLDSMVLAHAKKYDMEMSSSKIIEEKDWRNRYVVSSFSFKAADRVKFLKCEDSLVLQQVIHQYVMHKEGKATALDYFGDINFDGKVDSYWDGSTDVKTWMEYTSAEKGIRIRYDRRKGMLTFMDYE